MSWNLFGHEWAAKLLRGHLKSQNVRHAYLFTGLEGVGKRTLALRFAQALDCTSAPEPGEFCGNCRACRLIESESYPDLHIVEAERGTQVVVDQVRQLQRQLALAPYEGRWRIALFPAFDRANIYAANALLKTLEEPPSKVIMLLTARSAESLLPTIVSRCEVIPLRAPPIEKLAQALIEDGIAEERARLLACIAGGCPGTAFRMIKDPTLLEQRTEFLDDLMSLLSGNWAEQCNLIRKRLQANSRNIKKQRSRTIEMLDAWISLWRDVLVEAYAAEVPIGNPDRRDMVHRLASSLAPESVVYVLQRIEHALQDISRNANIQLTLETLMLDIIDVQSS